MYRNNFFRSIHLFNIGFVLGTYYISDTFSTLTRRLRKKKIYGKEQLTLNFIEIHIISRVRNLHFTPIGILVLVRNGW